MHVVAPLTGYWVLCRMVARAATRIIARTWRARYSAAICAVALFLAYIGAIARPRDVVAWIAVTHVICAAVAVYHEIANPREPMSCYASASANASASGRAYMRVDSAVAFCEPSEDQPAVEDITRAVDSLIARGLLSIARLRTTAPRGTTYVVIAMSATAPSRAMAQPDVVARAYLHDEPRVEYFAAGLPGAPPIICTNDF